jgi:hypothetical protein
MVFGKVLSTPMLAKTASLTIETLKRGGEKLHSTFTSRL